MEEPLRVLNFDDDDDLTSLEHFESKVESRNAPAVFRGCVKDWKAFSLWKPSNGGLDYLEGRVGTSIVEAMLSRSGPIFYGDIRGREMIPLPFSAFITTCKQRLQNSNGSCNVNTDSDSSKLIEPSATGSCLDSMDSHHQVYLAQVPILSMESKERSQLETLREDIQLPSILKSKVLTSINLWMNNAKSRSSTHYDPHHNLLCIVAGCKQVVLWSPSAGSLLYPMPVYGEASNHSSVDLGSPDFSIHPRAKRLMDYSQEVMLHAGDALFIPEGWYHQVDSDELTIAVNYWWQSSMVCNMQEHMDPYFLRILLRRWFILSSITQNPIDGQDHMLCGNSVGDRKNVKYLSNAVADGQKGREESGDPRVNYTQGTCQNHGTSLQHLEPETLQALHELISLIHDNVKIVGQSGEPTSKETTTVETEDESKKMLKDKSSLLVGDPIARIIWTLEPLKLRAVLLAIVHNFPRTLEALIIHTLSPLGAEVLTRKFDEMDQLMPKEERDTFYMEFYAVFDDQGAAMDAILSGKESFAQQALKNVLDKHLGVKN